MIVLLVIIYIAFISLGLPDSVLGPAWPSMRQDLSVPVSYAGMIAAIITCGTILSSFYSGQMIKRVGTGWVTLVSVFMTAAALWGFSAAPSFLWLCTLAVPLGLGAGAVDAALNNFVALHYEAKHMSWLHCFWGIGATAGPMLMSMALLETGGWRAGYKTIGIIQICLTGILVIALPLWKKVLAESKGSAVSYQSIGLRRLLKKGGVRPALLAFFCYCALEATAGLWGSSFLVIGRGMRADIAAYWIALFYLGITVGRLISGFAAIKFNPVSMIRCGQFFIGSGLLLVLLPDWPIAPAIGLLLIGLGCAPIYPCMLHQTPKYFGSDLSQEMMGMQMACAYIGAAVMPPLFGIMAEYAAVSVYPWYLFMLLIFMVAASERIQKNLKDI